MKEVLLLKYGELILKGANKNIFENAMLRDIKHKLRPHGNFTVIKAQSTVFVEPEDDFCDIDGALDACQKVFGIASICRATVCEKNMDVYSRVSRRLQDLQSRRQAQ